MAQPFASPDNNITSIYELVKYGNGLTGGDNATGMFGVAILIIVGFVSLLSTKRFPIDKSLGFTGFLCLIIAIFLRFLNLINDTIMVIVLVIFVGIVIFIMMERNREVGIV